MLNDFDEFKPHLDIVQKSFNSVGKPFNSYNHNIVFRDTMLLAPAGNRSLASIGKLYGEEFEKIELPSHYRSNMDLLLRANKPLFMNYAIRDAIITLKQTRWRTLILD